MREKGTNVKDIELVTDSPFEPTIIYKMLNNIRSEIFHVEGRQEDAEEFLGCILNKLNDEMLEVSFHYSKKEMTHTISVVRQQMHTLPQRVWKIKIDVYILATELIV